MIHALAFITTKPGLRDQVLQAFNACVPAVHAEEGCIEYAACIDEHNAGPMQTPVGSDAFVVVEKWASMGALKAHAASPHMAEYASKVKDLLASRVIHILEPA